MILGFVIAGVGSAVLYWAVTGNDPRELVSSVATAVKPTKSTKPTKPTKGGPGL